MLLVQCVIRLNCEAMGCGTGKTSLQLEWTQVLDLTEPYEGIMPKLDSSNACWTAPFARPAFNCYFLLTCFFEAKTDVIFQLVLLWLFYYFFIVIILFYYLN